MKLRAERSTAHARGTHWRPLARLTYGGERLQGDRLLDALSAQEHTPIGVEDPYRRGRDMGRFVISRASRVISHRSSIDRVEGLDIAPGSVIGPRVRIAATAAIGTMVEMQQGVVIGEGARIGDRSILLKNAVVGDGARLGGMVFIGQSAGVKRDVSVATGSVVEKSVRVEPNAQLGTQVHLQRGTRINANAWLDDGVMVGRYARIGEGAIIGSHAAIGHYAVIGEGSIIGAEAEVGDMGQLRPTAWVPAGQVIAGRDTAQQFATPWLPGA